MTAHPIDTEALRASAEQAIEAYGPAAWPDMRSADLLALLDALAAAEHRATRAEAQSAIRQKQVEYWRAETQRTRDRARQAEARIEAVQELIDQADTAGDWTVTCSRLQWAIDGTIRRALNGYTET